MIKIIILLVIIYFLTEDDRLPMVPTGKVKVKIKSTSNVNGFIVLYVLH